MWFSSMNFPNFVLRIVLRITLSILNHGSLTLHKIRESVLGGIKFDVALAPLLEANAILNAWASPIIKHASSKFKFLFSNSCSAILAFNLAM
jgi:hypothetical protein